MKRLPPDRPRQKRGRKAGNVRARKGVTTRPDGHGKILHEEGTDRVRAALRKARATELYAYQRLSMTQIAKQLTLEGIKTTAKTICLDLGSALEEANRQSVRNVAHGQALSGLRLDHLDRQLVPIALGVLPPGKATVVGRGKARKVVTIPIDGAEATRLRLQAVELLRRNDESRRKLFGYDAQPPDGFSVEQVASLLRALRSDLVELVPDEALRLTLARAIQRRSGLIPGVVEVTPENRNGGNDEHA